MPRKGAYINELGNTYGKLTVIDYIDGGKWICQCSCGNATIGNGADLRRGKKRSCGCLVKESAQKRIINELGNEYGRLTVVEFAGSNKDCQTSWRCLCECGNETVVLSTSLRQGNTKSCGCWSIESHSRPLGHAAKQKLYTRYKRGAKRRELEWGLTKEEFWELTTRNCYYCGIEPSRDVKYVGNGTYTYNGIDRLDNAGGYINGNVVTCCHTCNLAKRAMHYDEFKEWVTRVAHHLEIK